MSAGKYFFGHEVTERCDDSTPMIPRWKGWH